MYSAKWNIDKINKFGDSLKYTWSNGLRETQIFEKKTQRNNKLNDKNLIILVIFHINLVCIHLDIFLFS